MISLMTRYTLQDPIFRSNTRYPYLSTNSNHKSILGITRIITGTINCLDNYTNEKYNFRTNYTQLSFEEHQRLNQNTFKDIFPEEVSLSDINKYFRSARQNASFYSNIENELIKCLTARHENNYLESFFFLYRILEGICYSIPLIYTSKAKDFKQSYLSLKGFFSENKNDGELAFFKKFISKVYKDEDFFTSNIEIDINDIEIEDLRETYFEIYKKKIEDKYLEDSEEEEKLNIKFLGFHSFMIALRNRYFHFLQGSYKTNLTSQEIQYPNLFFKPLIDHGINWVSIILFEIIKYDFSNQ